MKKALLSTSAIAVAAAMAAPAQAVEWDVRVGGFMTQHVGVAIGVDIDNAVGEDYDGVDVLSNTEIIFRPSITLDNGLKFGAQVQLEGNTSGDQIDESFMSIDGSFGRVLIGSENSAGYLMTYAAPNVTAMPVNSGSISAYIPFSGGGGVDTLGNIFRNPKGSSFVEVGRNNDAQRITYFSPRFAGFQVGVSYARDGSQDDSLAGDNIDGAEFSNIFDIGANYVNSFGGIDVGVSGRYGIAQADDDVSDAFDTGDNPQVYAFGATLGFAGVTIGGAFAEANNSGDLDSIGYNFGVSYETGPWGVSFTGYIGEGVDSENQFAPTNNDEEFMAFLVGGSYDLAKGVGLSVYGGYVEADEQRSDDGTLGGDDVDGFVIGSAVSLSF